jgi:hypothetical protein
MYIYILVHACSFLANNLLDLGFIFLRLQTIKSHYTIFYRKILQVASAQKKKKKKHTPTLEYDNMVYMQPRDVA